MAIENQNDKVNEEEEGEFDLEDELVSSLTELRKVRREIKHFKEEIKNLENEIHKSNKLIESTKTMIIDLKLKTKEARVTEEALNNLLVEKEKENDDLRASIRSNSLRVNKCFKRSGDVIIKTTPVSMLL